jgi:hypothetical protein
MDERSKANAIVFRIEDMIHMFLLDDNGELLDLPSIPISDDEHIYDNLSESQIQFVNVVFSPIDSNKEMKFETYEDFEDLEYHIKDLFSYTLGKGKENNVKEITIMDVMKDNALFDMVKLLYKGDKI